MFTVAGNHVEGHLRIENILRQWLKREQVHGLLVQFVHALLSVFGGRFKYRGHRPFHRAGFLRPQHEQREHYRSGMGHYRRTRLQLGN
jgi:hypothetical protein